MTPELWFAVVSLAIGIVGAGFSLLASIIAYYVKRGESAQDATISALHGDHVSLRGDVDTIKQTLARYETHVGAGDARLQEIKEDIADHVRKEEQIFWKKVEAIGEAHKIFAEAVLQRIASMEAKMPNGEIADMVKALARLEANFVITQAASLKAEKHVEEHNIEAEDWKQRIVALETAAGGKGRTRVKK